MAPDPMNAHLRARAGQTGGPGSITVCIISYNHEKFVGEAVRSVLAQTHENMRVITIDDASSDATVAQTEAVLQGTDREILSIVHTANRGLCRTLNELLELVDTEYVAFFSADDVMRPDRIEKQVAYLQSRGPEYGAVYSDATRIDENGTRLNESFLEVYNVEPAKRIPDMFLALVAFQLIPSPTVVVRRSVFGTVGTYDESLAHEDYDMWLRVARQYKFGFIDECLVNYRELRSLYRRLYRAGQNSETIRKWIWDDFYHARRPTSLLLYTAALLRLPGQRVDDALQGARHLQAKLKMRAARAAKPA